MAAENDWKLKSFACVTFSVHTVALYQDEAYIWNRSTVLVTCIESNAPCVWSEGADGVAMGINEAGCPIVPATVELDDAEVGP